MLSGLNVMAIKTNVSTCDGWHAIRNQSTAEPEKIVQGPELLSLNILLSSDFLIIRPFLN